MTDRQTDIQTDICFYRVALLLKKEKWTYMKLNMCRHRYMQACSPLVKIIFPSLKWKIHFPLLYKLTTNWILYYFILSIILNKCTISTSIIFSNLHIQFCWSSGALIIYAPSVYIHNCNFPLKLKVITNIYSRHCV